MSSRSCQTWEPGMYVDLFGLKIKFRAARQVRRLG